ncbi:hypothetical protein FI667_g14859, partial [Globisporangium splendens]
MQFSFNIALSTYDASAFESDTLCSVVAEDVAATKLSANGDSVWEQEGVTSSAFAPQIYQNDVRSSNGTTTMFLVAQNGDFKGTKDACGSLPLSAIPCRKVSRSEATVSTEERKWCHPTSSSGGSSGNGTSIAVGGGNTTSSGTADSSSGSSSSTVTIILDIAIGVAVIICGVLLSQVCKRKDQSKVTPATSGYADTSASNLQQRSTGTTTDSRGNANQSPSARPSMSTTNIDAMNEDFRQQSAILAAFTTTTSS